MKRKEAKEKEILGKQDLNEAAVDEIVDEILDKAGLDDEPIKPGKPVDSKEIELKESKERLLRLMADFDNYRKRMQREKEDWFRYSSMGFIEKMLPVLDNMDLAMDNLEQQEGEIKQIFSGIQMIYRQLKDVLQQEGMKEVPGCGSEFDPLIHEAVMQVQAEGKQKENEVVMVMRKGYSFKEKLIRPAMVKVAKKQ